MRLLFLRNSFKTPQINQIRKFIHNYIFAMHKAYLRHLQDSDQFQLSLNYTDQELKINRQFNFCRQITEPVSSFLSRVATNIEKTVNKKNKRKKSNQEEVSNQTVSVSLLKNDAEVVGELLCKEVFQPGNNIVLKILDKEFNIIVNSPWIDSVALPKSILANFPTYPSKFETVFTNKQFSEFKWFKSKDKTNWTKVGESFIYTPSNNDVNCYLKFSCIPKNQHFSGPEVEVVSDVTVEASPGKCPFELRHQFTTKRASGKEFRMVTYNILADLYCDSDFTRDELYPYCPPYALAIDYRKQLIIKELIGYNADIICLQEVDKKVFNYDLEPTLSFLGYDSEFSIKGGQVAEGLACFYYKERFNKLEAHRIVLAEEVNKNPIFSDIWNVMSKNEKLTQRFLERTTAVQAIVLESKEHDEILIVANTHLYFHPDSDHIRLLQGGLAIRYVEHIFENVKVKYPGKRVSVVFCGDFNSVPECGIYKLYTTGNVSEDCIDFQSNKEESVHGLNLQQSFKLASACGTPKYTNFTAGFADCLDYIFYETSNLEVTQIIPLPSNEELFQNTALPSVVFPSDHLSLVADLKWL